MYKRQPDLNAIMGESGGATLGAVKAVRNQNQAGKIAVFGSDMTTEIAQELEDVYKRQVVLITTCSWLIWLIKT